MSQPMVDACAVSVLFNLPDYEVLTVTRDVGDGHRTVSVSTTATEAACPGCGVFTSRVRLGRLAE